MMFLLPKHTWCWRPWCLLLVLFIHLKAANAFWMEGPHHHYRSLVHPNKPQHHDRRQHDFLSVLSSSRTRKRSTNGPNIMTRFMAPSHPFKPAAMPLMEAGKAMATVGEMWVDLTSSSDFVESLYSSDGSTNSMNPSAAATASSWYACGVQLRNAGDALAQAAATGRFAYGMEMTCNEIRESASCFRAATNLLQQAITTATAATSKQDWADGNPESEQQYWRNVMERTISHLDTCSVTLEAAGAGMMQRRPFRDIGTKLLECGQALDDIANLWSNNNDHGDPSTVLLTPPPTLLAASVNSLGQQFSLVATRIIQAGNSLQPTTITSTTKSSTTQKPW